MARHPVTYDRVYFVNLVAEKFPDRLAAATEGRCLVCNSWQPIKTKINARVSGTVTLHGHRKLYHTAFCPGILAELVRVPDGFSHEDLVKIGRGMTVTARQGLMPSLTILDETHPTKEDMSMDAQTQELRMRLRAARAERELKLKTDRADAIVTRLDSLPAGSIIRFDKPYAAQGAKPAGTYTYVAIKPGADLPWYTTGCDANPLTSDDLASFMVGGIAITSWDVMGDAAETFQVDATESQVSLADDASDAVKATFGPADAN